MTSTRLIQLVVLIAVLSETPRHRIVHTVKASTVALGDFANDADEDFIALDEEFMVGGRPGHLHVMRDEGEHALREPNDPRAMKLRAVFGEFLNDDGSSIPMVTHGRSDLRLAVAVNLPSHVALDPVEQCRRRCGVAKLAPLQVSLVVDRLRLTSALATQRSRRLDVFVVPTAGLPKLDHLVELKPAGEAGFLEVGST